jgi:adenosine deaminase CECR1
MGVTDPKKFSLRLVITGLKIVGKSHITKMIDTICEGRAYTDLIAGFDMVNEEDVTPPILTFVPEILEGKAKDSESLPCFFHCGETHDRSNENLFDAVLLGTKRIGHGFQLFLHPSLQDEVKKQGICIEACPVSNLLLGYTTDLRCHPVRYMLHKGLQASISSDDPGFFGYDGVTMDYLMAYVAWDLSLRDLKKFSLNGIEYANVKNEHKKYLKEEVFKKEWNTFIQDVIAKYSA